MTFTSIPQNFTPIAEGLVFAFTTDLDEPSDVAAEIVDCATEEVVATLRLYNITTAEIDIAPYIAPFVERKPMRSATSTLCEAPTAIYKLRVGESDSSEVRVSLNRSTTALPTLVTTVPSRRHLAFGENDEFLLLVGEGADVRVDMEADTGDTLHLEGVSTSGAMMLNIVSADFVAEASQVDVTIHCRGEELATITYEVAPPCPRGVRLAWLSSEGSIERYTFPIAHSMTHTAERARVGRGDILQTVGCRSDARLSVASRYEYRAMATALSEIVVSPRVWLVGEEDTEVDVVTVTTTQSLFGEPTALALELRLWQREEALC